MKCWKCSKDQEDPVEGKLSFRATCEKCHAWLHCCRNCQFYKPGMANDCLIPGTDYIPDREASNFCEEFKLLGVGPGQKNDLSEIEKKLFGDVRQDIKGKKLPDSKDNFKSLFKDD